MVRPSNGRIGARELVGEPVNEERLHARHCPKHLHGVGKGTRLLDNVDAPGDRTARDHARMPSQVQQTDVEDAAADVVEERVDAVLNNAAILAPASSRRWLIAAAWPSLPLSKRHSVSPPAMPTASGHSNSSVLSMEARIMAATPRHKV